MTIQERIREARKKQGLTQKQLAERMGVTQSMVGQYETNRQPPKITTIIKIASALNVDVTYLISGENNDGTNANVEAFFREWENPKMEEEARRFVKSSKELDATSNAFLQGYINGAKMRLLEGKGFFPPNGFLGTLGVSDDVAKWMDGFRALSREEQEEVYRQIREMEGDDTPEQAQ